MSIHGLTPDFLNRNTLTRSFARRQVTNEYARITETSMGFIGTSPGMPKTEIDKTISVLITIDRIRGLLGSDSQKCLRSLTVNTVKYPEKTRKSKTNVCNWSILLCGPKYDKPRWSIRKDSATVKSPRKIPTFTGLVMFQLSGFFECFTVSVEIYNVT